MKNNFFLKNEDSDIRNSVLERLSNKGMAAVSGGLTIDVDTNGDTDPLLTTGGGYGYIRSTYTLAQDNTYVRRS